MSFYVGQKVVCVDDSNCANFTPQPVNGRVYVVREVVPPMLDDPDPVGLSIIGIRGDTHPLFGLEYVFRCTRFRPLEELKREAAERQRKEQPV